MPIALNSLHRGVLDVCNNTFYRQSFINDYLDCPQMSLYRWILQFDDESQFMAAILGTAGHACIYDMHSGTDNNGTKKFNYSYIELIDKFTKHFDVAIAEASTLPNIGTKYNSIAEQRDIIAPTYAGFLRGYQANPRNTEFVSTVNEQPFVMVIEDPRNAEFKIQNGSKVDDPLAANGGRGQEDRAPFIFTGTIDQAGYYQDGMFSLRDIKFRDNAFRPQKTEFDLNIQMTVYARALRFGNPACTACRPVHRPDGTLHYGGPCDKCKAKIGTPAWPRKFPNYCELIWMRDFETREKDEFQKIIKDPGKKKEINPLTGRMAIREIINPKWFDGHKKGEQKGPGFIITTRTPARIDILMSDILRICEQIRQGQFFRRPSAKCSQWCKQRERCVAGLELEVEEVKQDDSWMEFATEEPF